MTIQAGDKVPSVKLRQMTAEGPKEVAIDELIASKKAVIFAVPGAFTPTCSAKHLPGFVAQAEALKAKGAEIVICVSVNDVFVMNAWGKDQKTDGKVVMLADGNGEFTKAMGLTLDGSGFGMGTRSQRYALIAENGVITTLNVEKPGAFEVSSADAILQAL